MTELEIQNALNSMSNSELADFISARDGGSGGVSVHQSSGGNSIYIGGDVNITKNTTNNYYGSNNCASSCSHDDYYDYDDYYDEIEEVAQVPVWQSLGFEDESSYTEYMAERRAKRNKLILATAKAPFQIAWYTTKGAWWTTKGIASFLWWFSKYINGDTDEQRQQRYLSTKEKEKMAEEVIDAVIVDPTKEDYQQAKKLLTQSDAQRDELDEINKKFQQEISKHKVA